MTELPRYFFVHIQKAAGTSLHRSLRGLFGPEALYPLPEDARTRDAQIDVELLREVWARERHRLRVLTGHFPLCTGEVLGESFRTFTILREPVARTLSFLRHRKLRHPELADTPMEEIYGNPKVLHSLIHNHMVKMLGITPELMTHGVLTMAGFEDGYLERAKDNLERIDVWGLQEDYPTFHRELEATFGWDLGPELRVNTTETESEPVTERFVERILRDNALDVALYDHAVRLHRQKVVATG